MENLNLVSKNKFNFKAMVLLISVSVLLSIFIPITKARAAEWYDSGWISASDARFHGDKITNECPGQVGIIATVILSYGGNPWRAWVNVNAPAGNYKIDMKLGYTHKLGSPDQTNETMRLYSKTGITSTAVPTNYTDKANVADLDSHTINPDRECADLANSIHTYSNVIGGTLKFSENGDLFIQGTGDSINVKAVRIYGYKEHEDPAPTCSISANPTSILNGQYSTLSWTSQNATSCTASNAWSGIKSLSGTQSVSPDSYSTYTLNCSGPGGSVTCSASVSVTANPAPTCSISANPASISNGQYSTLTWNSTNATSCTASNAWSGIKSLSGTQYVAPSSDSTYTLNCSGIGESVTCSASVSVTANPAPTCSISANPASISNGQYSTLTWNSTNATSCTASNAWSGIKSLSGTQYVAPSSDSTYTLNCSGIGESVTCSASVSVTANPAPTCSISANPTTVSRYDYSNLTWSSSNATSCVAYNGWSGNKSLSGSQSVYVSSGNTYTLVCSNSYNSATCSTSISIKEENNNPDITIDKLVRNITNGYGFSNSVNANYNDELEFSLTVHSTGDTTAQDVRVWDNLPSYLTYISGSTTVDGSYRSDGITTGGIYVGDLYSGGTRTIKFRVRVNSETNNYYSTLTNYGYASADNVSYVYDTATVIIENEPTGTSDLRINKLVRNLSDATGFFDSVNADPGKEVEFSIQLNSVGNKSVNNVRVWDSLPSDLTYISGSTTVNGSYRSDGIVSGGIYVGTINSGQSIDIRFKARVSSSIVGTSGIITIDAGNQNIQTSNNNLSISKKGRNITQNQTVWSYTFPAYYGDTLEFSTQITNNSGSTIDNVTIKESLSSNLSFVSNSITIDGSSWSGDINTSINLGTMTNGQVKTIKFRATVVGGVALVNESKTLTNIAYANGDNISQVYDQASIVISGTSGQVLGATYVSTGANLFGMIALAVLSLIVALFVYCRVREDKILEILNNKKTSKLLKQLIKIYFKMKYIFTIGSLRFKKVYF